MSNLSQETINERIRNQLTPMVNILVLIDRIKNAESVFKRDLFLNMLYELKEPAETSVQKLCSLGYNAYEENDRTKD